MSGITWSDRAKDDLWEIGRYWTEHNPSRVTEIADRIDEAAAFIAATPRAGPAFNDEADRKWRIARTDYILTYRVMPDSIQVLRLHHVRQNWRSIA